MATAPRPAADIAGTDGIGRTRWRRFVGLLLPVLLVVALMISGVLNGRLPISVAAEGQQRIKIEIKEMSASGYGAFPQFFETQDGRRRTVVVIGLSDARATGLCGSGKVKTPIGDYVLRVETKGDQQLRVDDFQMAVENVDGADFVGGAIEVNRHDTAPDGTPVDSGDEGTLPLTLRSLLLDLHADVRWITASGMTLSGMDLTAGLAVPECF